MSLWNKYQQKIIKNCNNPLDHEGNLSYWRDYLFGNTLTYIIPLIALMIIPSTVHCLNEGYYALIFLNVKVLIVSILVAFVPALSVNLRKIIFCSFAYLHSIILIFFLGDFGGGLIFLMGISIFFITIFPNKYAFWPIYFDLGFGFIFALIIKFDLITLHDSVKGKTLEWIVLCLSLAFLVAIFSFLLPRLFASMQSTIDKQKKLQLELNSKNIELLESEEKLRLLNAELESRVAKRTRDLEEANIQLETFSYSISHDLQSPIRAINVYTVALEKESKSELSEKGKDFLNNILSATVRMTDLIQSLLKFSQINKQGISKKEIDLNSITKAVWINLTHQNTQKIDFKIRQLPKVNGDKILIQQVVENLLSNAIKYSSKKELPSIEVGANDGVVYVKDNGVGFSMSNHNRIFSIFKRLHTDDEFEGTGVGLSIVKLIIERHGGKIWAESEKDKGATFYFTFNA